jgi:hypothetical protein
MKLIAILGLCLMGATAYALSATPAFGAEEASECFVGVECSLITESSDNRFFIGKEEASREVKCKLTLLEGKVKTGDETLQLIPTYKECTAAGGVEAVVTTQHCYMVISLFEDLEGESPDLLHSGLISFLEMNLQFCGIEISIPFTGCVVTIKEQGPLEGVELLNEKEKGIEKYEQMKLTFHVTKVAYNGGLHCPEEGAKENGGYGGTALVMGLYLK